MKVIKAFLEKLKSVSNAEGFILQIDREAYLFTQVQVGIARHVYGHQITYGTSIPAEVLASQINHKLELVAIVAGQTVYITNPYMFDLYHPKVDLNALPQNVVMFSEKRKYLNTYVENSLFPKYLEQLPVDETVIPDYVLDNLKKAAREEVLFGRPSEHRAGNMPTCKNMFNDDEISAILCGLIDLEAETQRRFEEKRDEYVAQKSANAVRQRMIEDQDVVLPYEREIGEGLASLDDAKSVNVEFTIDGKTASEKIDPNTVIRCMVEKSYFRDYSFQNQTAGKRLFAKLGAVTDSWKARADNLPLLTSAEISRITYGKKVVYKKEEVVRNATVY